MYLLGLGLERGVIVRSDPGGVMADLTEDFVRRMRNWAMGSCGSSIDFAQVDLAGGGGTGAGYREASMPVLTGEAKDTDDALHALPIRYRRAVELYWAWETTELSVLARRCGGIDYRTYVIRVKDGHILLRVELAKRAEEWRARRAANALAVQVAARPCPEI